jgi:hypothetical protein
MENIVTISFFVTVLFIFLKFIEYKFIDKSREMKPLKFFIRDTVIVFISSIAGAFFYYQINGEVADLLSVITDKNTIHPLTTQVFTDSPGF